MLKIEVKSEVLTPRTITPQSGKNAGRPMTFHEQEAFVFTHGPDGQPRPYPERIVLNVDVEKGHKAYAAGIYYVHPMSFYVNRFNNLEVGRLMLQRAQDVQNLKAAA